MEHKNGIGVIDYSTNKKIEGNTPSETKTIGGKPKVYLIYDVPDLQLVKEVKIFLTEDYCVIEPDFDGTLVDRRTHHENNLIQADIIMIYYGRENMLWLRTKLLDILKSLGLGRNKPLPKCLIYAAQQVNITQEAVLKYHVTLVCHHEAFPATQISDFLHKAITPHEAVSE